MSFFSTQRLTSGEGSGSRDKVGKTKQQKLFSRVHVDSYTQNIELLYKPNLGIYYMSHLETNAQKELLNHSLPLSF